MGDRLNITQIWVTIVAKAIRPKAGGDKLVRGSQRYIAIIADMVGSRSMARPQRRVLQQQFARVIASLNRDYRKTIASKFVITLGDEFQGLLNSAIAIPDLIWPGTGLVAARISRGHWSRRA